MGEGIVLSDAELRALARRLITRQAADFDQWLSWEDVPELAESSWLALADAVEARAKRMTLLANDTDRAEDIDSLALIERVS